MTNLYRQSISGAFAPLPLLLLSIGGFCVLAFARVADAQSAVPPASQKAAASVQSGSDPIKAALTRKKIVVKAGVETFENADAVRPGDVIEESVTYTNVSATPISKFVAQLPVPSNTELILNSPKPAIVQASLDGAQYASIPLKRVTRTDGKPAKINATTPVEVAVPLNEYRYLRWSQNEINPGKSVSVSARFRVLSNDLNIQPAKNDVATNSSSSIAAK